MTTSEILVLLGLNLLLVSLLMVGLWALAPRMKNIGFIDAMWPLGLLTLALATLPRTEGDATRKWLLVWLCGVWAVRLGLHLLKRWRLQGSDGRYADVLAGLQASRGWSDRKAALLCVFLPQGALIWLTGLPVQLGQVAIGPPVGWLGWFGAVLAVLGIGLESIADSQLAAFRKSPGSDGRVLESGLWRYSRHPNYFGDACVWWGLWLIAAETTPGLFAVVGLIVLTLILLRWSGSGVTETSTAAPTARSDPAWVDYIHRTSAFIPWPPRRP